MIDTSITSTIVVDLGRPNIFTANDHKKWCDIHRFIKESDIPTNVSSVFWFVERILDDPAGRYGGGGFKYCFWFNTKDDSEKFLAEINRCRRIHNGGES